MNKMNKMTNRLLACGILAGPLFIVVVVIQSFARSGFDLTKQAASLLTLGGAGWIQSANFLITGALLLAFSAGLRRAFHGGAGSIWAPRLLVIAGIGLGVGGIFHPDAGDGFPPGTPSGQSVVRTWHGLLHMIAGFSAFLALIALCFVVARYFRTAGPRSWAMVSRVAGTLFAICVIAANGPDGSLTLFAGASIVLIWIAIVAQHLTATSVVWLRLAAEDHPSETADRFAAHEAKPQSTVGAGH